MLAAMATGETRIENFSASKDCAATLECLRQLGVDVDADASMVVVQGVGKNGFKAPAGPLDCGNSGTSMRLLAGILAGQGFESVLSGDESLSGRPMKRVIEPLSAMGAEINAAGGRAPIRISGRNPLDPIDYLLPVASAQIKSCVLLAGLNATGATSVAETTPTRDHTERMLRWFGVHVEQTAVPVGHSVTVQGDSELSSPGTLRVPGDISAAAFFIVAAACLPTSDLRMRSVGINPTRSGIIDVMRALGADVGVSDACEVNNEPVATISVTGPLVRQHRSDIQGGVIANLIDELPVLAVLGTQLESGLVVRDAAELRVKESDRIRAVVENLRRMSAEVDEFDDGFRVVKSTLKGARLDSFGDHRIAMAFSVAGLLAEGESEIVGAECAAVSFPNFFEVLESVVVR